METFAYRRAEDLPDGAEPHSGPPDLSALLGAWRNTDEGASGGIVQLLLVERDRTLRVHAFGAGAPEPYDWGEIDAVPYAASVASGAAWAFTATYDFGFLARLSWIVVCWSVNVLVSVRFWVSGVYYP